MLHEEHIVTQKGDLNDNTKTRHSAKIKTSTYMNKGKPYPVKIINGKRFKHFILTSKKSDVEQIKYDIKSLNKDAKIRVFPVNINNKIYYDVYLHNVPSWYFT